MARNFAAGCAHWICGVKRLPVSSDIAGSPEVGSMRLSCLLDTVQKAILGGQCLSGQHPLPGY